jgi:hypothetical protein
VSDEEIQALKRAVGEAPGDSALAWRYARAVERVDRRAFLLEVSRLARRGDAEARTLVAELLPLPRRGPYSRPAPTRRAPLTEAPAERRATLTFRVTPDVIAATDRVVFVQSDEGVAGVDTETLGERWRVSLPADACAVIDGEDLIASHGSDVLLVDGDRGTELARARLPGAVHALVSAGERSAAIVGANEGRLLVLVGFDSGRDFGRVIWKRMCPGVQPGDADLRSTLAGIFDDALVLEAGTLLGLGIEDGKPGEAASHTARVLAGSHRGHWSREICTTRDAYYELARGSSSRLHAPLPEPALVATPIVQGAGRGPSRTLLDLPPLRGSSPTRLYHRSVHALLAASTAVYVVSAAVPRTHLAGGGWTISNGADFANLLVIDAGTGAVRLDRDLDVELSGEFHSIEAIPLDRALLVTIATPGQLTLVRFE